MSHLSFRTSRPDSWTLPRQAMHASERFYRHGAIQPMDYGRPGFAVTLLAYGLNRLRRFRGAASLARGDN